ncbi:hypothetical protein J437_LFUL000233 [Ladona fulva]|uniref:Cytochrome c oxidase assembly factor 1 homolog n=1 Tax=Ladona fulva TaxID=123851 RepID=A0A8K0JV05_LADFU|nr:hypothetical protein J437_LFUL000233 [Ladona fulva]
MVSNAALARVAVFGGVITASTGFILYWKMQDNLKKTEYYTKALRILRSHPPAISLLGEPIKDGRVDLDDRKKNYCDGLKAQIEVPVRGPKQKGTLYFSAERAAHTEPWDVSHVELGLANEPNRRLRILNKLKTEDNGEE